MLRSRARSAWLLAAALAVAVAGPAAIWAAQAPAKPALPENLAPKAKVSATSEFSDQYLAKFAVDGKVPDAGSSDDLSRAWAVRQPTAGDKGTFTLEWEKPVRVAEIVYYARTAWQMQECWKDYEVYVDDAAQPAVRGQFKMMHGPQRVKLAPVEVRRVSLKFLNSYGGSNPGASEIQVFSESPAEAALRAFASVQSGPMLEESPELAKAVADGKLGFDKLLLIKRRPLNPSHVYTRHCEGFGAGGGLYVLSPPKPDGQLKELVSAKEGQILDADVSFDGREIVFSWRKDAGAGYHVYRINADGTGLAQLTDGPWHDYNACWLPDGGIAFVSTRSPRGALCWVTASGVLHRMDRDGGNVERLSSNYVDDFAPAVMPDGRILYTRWEYVDRPAIPIQSLWTVRPDGTQLQAFYGNRVLSPASFMDAVPVPGTHQVLCILTAHNGPIRGGLGLIDNHRGLNAQEALTNLTPEVNIGQVNRGDGNSVRGPYEMPKIVDEKRFTVSRSGVLLLCEVGGGMATLYSSNDGLGCYAGLPIRPRPAPPVLGNRDRKDPESHAGGQVADGGEGEATVYLVDVYQGLEPQVKRGQVKGIRVVEELPKQFRTDVLGFGFQRPVISCGAAYAAKKVWGTAAVEDDGSAYFKVPTGKALYFIAVDSSGVGLQRMRSFAQFVPGEVQGCIGCHEPRSTTPTVESRSRMALAKPARKLEPPSWGATGFDYARVVQPVIDKHCTQCHNGLDPQGGVDLAGDRTDWFNVSYDVLTRRYVNWIDTRNGNEANILQIAPLTWGSPKSKLTDLLLSGHPDKEGKKRVTVDADGLARIFMWIDLNVPYYGTYDMDDEHRPGGRQVHPNDLPKVMADVWKRRCADCHKGRGPSTDFVRITNIEHNPFLAAPLAKSAGGRGACKGEVFTSADDPDYRAILKTFESSTTALKNRPRIDMEGARPEAQVNRSRI